MGESLESRIRTSKIKPVDSLKWLYNKVRHYRRSKVVPNEAFNIRRGGVFIGGMFVYRYDPKTKDKLPWWDNLPVVIPIELYENGWLGLNLHYVPPRVRVKLLDRLSEFKRRARTPRAYMRLSYAFLKQTLEMKMFEPCIKRYLHSHLTTPLVRIEDEYWEMVAMLPIQEFRQANAQKVWANPRGPKKRIRKKK